MKLAQIRNLVAIAQRGSVKVAANELGISESALLRSIRELEREFATPLVKQGRTAISLTTAGQILVRRATAAQLELDRARMEVAHNPASSDGLISIGISPDQLFGLLQNVLRPFHTRFPHVRLRIVEGPISKIADELRDGLLDLYVGPIRAQGRLNGMKTEILHEAAQVVVGRKGHPLADATSLAALAGARWIAPSRWELDALFEQHGLPWPTIAIEAETGFGMVWAAASSDALVLLSGEWLEWLEGSNMLSVVRMTETPVATTIGIVTRTQLPLTPAAAHLYDLITQKFGRLD